VFGRRPTFDRLGNRRLGTVLFDPHDEYFILPTKATDLAPRFNAIRWLGRS
jgi:hypothetical protein